MLPRQPLEHKAISKTYVKHTLSITERQFALNFVVLAAIYRVHQKRGQHTAKSSRFSELRADSFCYPHKGFILLLLETSIRPIPPSFANAKLFFL
jgi:hypothetical protein